jgi:hypothetical protein
MSSYFKKIDKILDTHQMPPEYQNTKSLVYCNDCETKSTTKYHFLYHKCQNCSGYNTKMIQTLNETIQENDITRAAESSAVRERLSTISEDITITESSSSDMEMVVDESESTRDFPGSASGPPQF